MIHRKIGIIFVLLLGTLELIEAKEVESYNVQFEGPISQEVWERLASQSQLVALQKHPPATLAGLKRRAEADITNLVQTLHSFAYYNAHITLSYPHENKEATVVITIDPGPIYPLEKVIVEGIGEVETELSQYHGKAALPALIVEIEKELIKFLECSGYPFARLEKVEVLADQESKSITLTLKVESGPIAYFGDLTVLGNKTVKYGYFKKHTAWCLGDLYSPNKIACTQRALELSQLFSSVSITYPEAPLEGEELLPMTIEVQESKQRSIGLGVNYASQRGPGCSFEWEHRNFRGMGETLSARTNLWHDEQFAKVTYLQPDIFCYKQNLQWQAELYREKTKGYTTRSLSLSALLSRPHWSHGYLSYGLKYVFLHDTDIHEDKKHQNQKHKDERFQLLKVPLRYSWDCSDDLLDPSGGYRVKLKIEPSYQLMGQQFIYSINTLTASPYWRLSCRPNIIAAGAITFGSITGPKKSTIPRSELFDAGTATLLRGYKYKTVSPLDNKHDPTGGRSMLIGSLELRLRMNKEIGWVTFYDFGNVYSNVLPDLKIKFLHSLGLGFRYYTPVGPIRFDLAFPLNPRPHVDTSFYQFYLSIGQTF